MNIYKVSYLSIATIIPFMANSFVIHSPLQSRVSSLKSTVDSNDIKRAHECTETVGVCSTEELLELQQKLHEERLENYAASHASLLTDQELDHLWLEKDLEYQLKQLQERMGLDDNGLDGRADLESLPMDGIVESGKSKVLEGNGGHPFFGAIPLVQSSNSVPETLAILTAMFVLVFAPNLLHS